MSILNSGCLRMDQDKTDVMERRSVTVLQLPERFSLDAAGNFAHELERCINVGRPYLVLDCLAAGQLDKPMAGLLLYCLEEAMKRNGDVKLACISLAEQPVLQAVSAHRLFEAFDTVEEAIDSFHQFPSEAREQESAA
ncbi:MAG: STAS domain-containing protein [Acidobacteriaceae bacterium]